MSRFEARLSELVEAGYRLEHAKEVAKAEESERQTNALERIAEALEKQASVPVKVIDQTFAEVLAKAARREPTSGSKS